MYTLLRQVFVAILGGVIAAGVMVAANNFERTPNIALAQTSTNISSPDSSDADARRVINYQGQVYNPNGGAPYVNVGLNFSFRLYNNPTGTNLVYQEDQLILTNVDGFFNTHIGANLSDVQTIFNGQELYLRVFVNNQELSPIQPITFVPYAFWSIRSERSNSTDRLGSFASSDFPKIVAYGVVNGDGGRASGENFNSSRGNVAGATVYIIDLPGINHSIFDFTTIVTPACDSPVMTGVGTSQGDLLVDVWDPNGSRTQCRFEFMVLRK